LTTYFVFTDEAGVYQQHPNEKTIRNSPFYIRSNVIMLTLMPQASEEAHPRSKIRSLLQLEFKSPTKEKSLEIQANFKAMAEGVRFELT